MKKKVLFALALVASLFFPMRPSTLKADSAIPVAVTFTTDAKGFSVDTGDGFLDGLLISSTAPTTNGLTVTFQLHDLASATALTTAASLIGAFALDLTATSKVFLLPPAGIHFSNGLRFVDANTTTVNATFVTSSR